MKKTKMMTSSERATYQALVARGVSPEDAYEDALDGVDVDTVRENDKSIREKYQS